MFSVKKLQGAGGFGVSDSYWVAYSSSTFGTANWAQGLAIDPDDRIMMCFEGGTTDQFITVFDTDGTHQWTKEWTVTDAEIGDAVALSTGEWLVGGRDADTTYGSYDVLITKYSADGSTFTTRRHGSSTSEGIYGLEVDDSDNVYLGGYDYNGSSYDGAIAKFAGSNLTSINWLYRISGWGSALRNISVDSAGQNLYAGNPDGGVMAKISISGTPSVTWARNFSAGGTTYIGSTANDSSDNVYVGGSSAGVGSFVTKLNSSGTEQWTWSTTTITGGIDDIQVDAAGNVYCLGNLYSGTPRSSYLVKLSSSGSLLWCTQFDYGTTIQRMWQFRLNSKGTPVLCGNTYQSKQPAIFKLPPDAATTGTFGGWTLSEPTLSGSLSVTVSSTSAPTLTSTSWSSGTTSISNATGTHYLTNFVEL